MPGPADRLAALLGPLTRATDVAAGLPVETAARVAVLASTLADLLHLPRDIQRDCYYAGLLRFLGCTSFAYETARLGAGDDMGLLRTLTPSDARDPLGTIGLAARGLPARGRLGVLLRLATSPTFARSLATAHCGLAVELGGRLGLSAGVRVALGQMYERWDGGGAPAGLRGDAIAVPARVVHLAFRAEAHRALEADPIGTVRARRGTELDPAIADAFLREAPDLLALAAGPSAMSLLLAAEPEPYVPIDGVDLPGVLGDYADAKSPWMLGHSPEVARLAVAAGMRAGLGPSEREELRRAALLHDVGRCAVPNGIWDKPGPLDASERARAEEHATWTAQLTGARLASAAHERADARGYPSGRAVVPGVGALLGAADVWVALRADRPWRPALSLDAAAREMEAEVRSGHLDADATAAVLGEVGVRRQLPTLPDGLSPREVQVLCLVARGLSNKEIAERLAISARTVGHHVANARGKTGCANRAAAAVYVVGRSLAGRVPEVGAIDE